MTSHSNTTTYSSVRYQGPKFDQGRAFGRFARHRQSARLCYRYYEQGADELIFMDAVASLYGRNHLAEIAKSVNIFVP